MKENTIPTKKQLLKMPDRKDKNLDRIYDWLLIIPAGTKHSSGFMRIAVVGRWVDKRHHEHYEICSYPDDINWLIPDSDRGKYKLAHLRTDCFYPQGILKFWGRGKFKVDWGSSTEIVFIPDI